MPFFLAFGGHEVRLAPGESIIGREKSTHVCLEDPSISRRHARVLIVQREVYEGAQWGLGVLAEKVGASLLMLDGEPIAPIVLEYRMMEALLFATRLRARVGEALEARRQI